MVEITHGGTWLNWRALNRRDRNLALLSYATAFLAAVPLSIHAGVVGYQLGFRLGSGGELPAGYTSFLETRIFAWAMLAAAVFALISAIAWWRFSRNQDEMFNRIQNYAIAQAGGWTLAVLCMWWFLSLGGWLGPLPLTAIVVFGTALLIAFWLRGVRRWL